MFGLKLRADFNRLFVSDDYGPHGLGAAVPAADTAREEKHASLERMAFKVKGRAPAKGQAVGELL